MGKNNYLMTNNVFVQFDFISWQEVKSLPPPPKGGIYCSLNFLRNGRGREEKEKTRMSDVDKQGLFWEPHAQESMPFL